MMTRRSFLSCIGFAVVGMRVDAQRLGDGAGIRAATSLACGMARHRARVSRTHPPPRKGITGAKVLAASELAAWPDLQRLFDGIRAIPGIADGIRCSCGCAELPGYYSLLSCYEGEAMARICPICQGAGRLTVRLHDEGQTLAQIRVAVDAQFG